MQPDSNVAKIAELEEKIRRLENALSETQSLTAVGELAGVTAHEFNNLLTIIVNYARMGQRHKDDETRDGAFAKILDASNRAAKIVAVVLGLARNRRPGREPTDVVKLVDDTLLLLEREMSKYRIEVVKKFQTVPNVLANGNQIQQVLVNLLVNARQASPNGGQIIVKIRPCEESDSFVDVVVRDYGEGMSKERLAHIFDMFYTTKKGPDASGKGGAGLGLPLCKRVMEQHRGKIIVSSALGKGTSFTLRIPAATNQGEQEGSN